MSTQTFQWLPVGEIDDIPMRGARSVDINGKRIALFRVASGEVFALADACPHQAGPLSQGIVHGDCVTCPLHNWVISLRDGTAQGADQGSSQRFPVKQDDTQLFLGIDVESIEPDGDDNETAQRPDASTEHLVNA